MGLCRGTTEGADCENCPFARDGGPRQPVVSEFPTSPEWILVGEGPGNYEVMLGRPFMGPSGQVVNDLLARAGQERSKILVTNATLCRPTPGSTDEDRQRAALACNTRLKLELSRYPKLPIFTLGAVAAKAVIPQTELDKIDPPESLGKRKRQKQNKAAIEEQARKRREEKLEKKIAQLLHQKLVYRRKQIVAECKAMRGKPDHAYLERRLLEDYETIEAKAKLDAEADLAEQAARKAERKKHPKKKPIKITDIISTLFEVDVDGTGNRFVIPGIHPAALLRGGGKSIAGTHTPDLAFINLIADAAKVRALAQGKRVQLALDIETEFVDGERASRLTHEVLHEAFEEGAVACDLETYVDDTERYSALQAYKAKIRAIGFATKRRSVSVLWDLLDEFTREFIRLVLASPRVTVVFHNALYDRTVFMANGFYVSPEVEDTLLMHHAAFPGNAHNLQQVTAQFFATRPWKSEYRNTEETPEGLTLYNAKDTGSTQALVAPLTVWLKRTKTEQVYALDKKMSEISTRMHLDGVPMSREANKRLLDGYTMTVAESRRVVEKIAEDPDTKEQIWHHLAWEQAIKKRKKDPDSFEERYNARFEELKILDQKGKWRWKIGASKHISSLLKAKGVMLVQKTATGDTSTKKEILEGLGHIPIVRDILEYREGDKLRSTFLWPHFDQFDLLGNLISCGYADENDRCHPTWLIHKITGRWASVDPVYSNWPKAKLKKIDATYVACDRCREIVTDEGKACGCGRTLVLKKKLFKVVRPNLRQQVVARPGRTLIGFDFCLAPGTRALRSDLKWIPVDQLKVGEELVGFDEEPKGRETKFRGAKIEAVKRLTLPCARVETDRGTVIASMDHRWLRRGFKKGRAWVRTEDLRPGDKLAFFTDPWSSDQTWENGYVAGFLDGEGWVSTTTKRATGGGAGFGQNEGPTLDRVVGILRRRGYDLSFNKNKTGCVRVLAKGEWQSVRLVGEFQPPRLMEKARSLWEGRSTWGHRSRPAVVKRIVPIGDHPVVAVRTSTKTFIAEGFLTHNSQLEARLIALVSGDAFLTEVFKQGRDLHYECAAVIFGKIFEQADEAIRKQLRENAKNFEYGAFYGGSPETLWKTLLQQGYKIELKDVVAAVSALLSKMPGIIQWQRRSIYQASHPPNQIVDVILGRRRTFPMGQVDPNEAINFGIQTAGSGLMNQGMDRMTDRLLLYKEAYPILQIHDAAVFEVWEDDADKIECDIKESFETEVGGIPFPVEVKQAQSWDKL